jgi:MYXO-CTERM domain-containing protein
MWEMFEETGLGPEAGMQLVTEAFFMVEPTVSFLQYGHALVAADEALHEGKHVDAIKRVLWRRGFLRVPEPPGELAGGAQKVAVDVRAENIGKNVDDGVLITHPGATAMRVHFSFFDMEADGSCYEGHCDNVYLFDGVGRMYAILGGEQGPFDSVIIPGDTVLVRWVSDLNTASKGFRIDRYEWAGGGPGPEEEPEGGCGCRVGGGGGAGGAGAVGLILAGLVLIARRRRGRC